MPSWVALQRRRWGFPNFLTLTTASLTLLLSNTLTVETSPQ